MWKMIVQRIIIGWWCVIADGEVCCVSISNKRYKDFLPIYPTAIKIFSKGRPHFIVYLRPKWSFSCKEWSSLEWFSSIQHLLGANNRHIIILRYTDACYCSWPSFAKSKQSENLQETSTFAFVQLQWCTLAAWHLCLINILDFLLNFRGPLLIFV